MVLRIAATSPPLLLLLILTITTSFNVGLAGESPFTAKASLIRYWKKQVSGNNLPSPFFLDKASPLDAVKLVTFSNLAGQRTLTTQLSHFCQAANLLCFPDVGNSLEKHSKDSNFAEYAFKNFTSYGEEHLGGADSFKNYTSEVDTFRRYSRSSIGHDDEFTNYATDTNVVDQRFNTYGSKTTGGTGKFTNYNDQVNVPGLTFTSYSDNTNGRTQDFKKYAGDANAGDEKFTSYGKNGNGATNDFASYGNNSNVVGSTFGNYGEMGNGATDNFTSYGEHGNVPTNSFNSYARGGNGQTESFTTYGSDGNVPTNNFKSYGSGGNGITETFKNYRDQSNVGDDSFQSYGGDHSNAASLDFASYGKSFNDGSSTFKGYGKDTNAESKFNTYGVNTTFKEYAKTGVTFASYVNDTGDSLTAAKGAVATAAAGGKKVNSKWVEPGKFFREKMLKAGTVMPMPDIKDKMPKRSFLPRAILSKLPFSSAGIDELKKTFHAAEDSSMTRIIGNALSECERAPSAGETKRCAGSGEDMIDFATSVLGRNVVVRTTENTKGSGGNIMIGAVKGINGGKVTKSVSCHQSLYPYLLYYCHSVPKVRVYEADILDPSSKKKINRGIAICHIDTLMWSQNHGAFLALGSGPGKIEVCHWIFENDMTWTISD